jgi:hypothetical protein
MLTSSQVCQITLSPQGLISKTVGAAAAEMLVKLRDDSFKPLTLAEKQATRKQLDMARYHSFRDGSYMSKDIQQDTNVLRRGKRLSITRDMLDGPQLVQNCTDISGGRLNGRRMINPGEGVGGDKMRFVKEAFNLRMYGIVDEKDLPDWTSDESIRKFFGMVYDKALEEAKSQGVNPSGVPTNRVLDSAPGIFLFTELLKRTERLIEEDFTELWARQIFPVLSLNTWLPQWSFERIDDRTEMPQYVDVTYLPSNAPRGSENRAAALRNLAFWHHAASWSNIELMRYAEGIANGAPNIKLDQRRTNAAVRMMNVKEDLLTFFGDPDVDILGLFSPEAQTGIERVPSGGQFGSGTTEQDRELLTRQVKQIFIDTEAVLRPNTIMLSVASWAYVVDKRYGDAANASNETVLQAADATLRQFGITDILLVPEVGWSQKEEDRLKAHGIADAEAERLAGGLDGEQTMVIMKRDPDVLEMVEAKKLIMYPARETVNDRVEARMLAGGGGLAVYKPEGVKIVTDVGPAA